MARQNRRDIFDPNEVGAFHAVQRTVRRAWLCGLDPVSGKSFEHRRTWIQNRLEELAASFGIDCLSFAVMVNHVHVILRNRPDVVAGWSDEEVANVDLNPVRAGVADAPEKSPYTSVYERVTSEKAEQKEKARAKIRRKRGGRTRSASSSEGQVGYVRRDEWLTPLTLDEPSAAYQGAMPSKSGKRASDKGFLGMSFELYLKLLDWTGRQIRRDNKKGRIPAELAPIMERIGLSGELWCDVVKRFGKIFKRVAGTPESLAQEAILRGRSGYRTGSSPLPSAG